MRPKVRSTLNQVKRLVVKCLKKTTTTTIKKKTLNMLTIRVDCERINGRYTNAEYRAKMTRCDLTLNIGPYAGCVCVLV